MKKTKKTALTAAAFAAAMGMTVCSPNASVTEFQFRETLCANAEYISYYSLVSDKGDVYRDGLVNLTDVVYLQKYLLKQVVLTFEEYQNADVNDDGKVNIFDLMLQKKELLDLCNIPQPDYGPEWWETEPTETYQPETDEPVCVYGPPEYFGITEPEETDETEPDSIAESDTYQPESDFPVDVYGPPEMFGD